MNSMQNRQDTTEDDAARTPLWALVGAPVVMFAVSSGAFWAAYVWMSAANPMPAGKVTALAAARAPVTAKPLVRERAPVVSVRAEAVAVSKPASRRAQKPPVLAPVINPGEQPVSPPEPHRAEPEPKQLVQTPCPVRVTESQLAQGKASLPPSARRVAIVLHRSGSTAEGKQEADRQVLAVINNLAPADSFTVVATAGQGSIFSPEPVPPQPQSVEALRTWMKALPGGIAASLETGVSTALSMPAINKVVVVADIAPEREAETWRRLSDVVRTGNRFGAAVSAVTVTPRCTSAIAPAKGQGSGSEEPPFVARETIVAPGL